MWWPDTSRTARLAAALALAGLLGGCFQPLYGNKTLDGGPSVNAALTAIDISQIPAANGTPEARRQGPV